MTANSDSDAPRAFHIFGLIGFAFSLPLFITFNQSQVFFRVHAASPQAIVAFALTLGIVMPGAIARIVKWCQALGPKPYRVIHALVIFLALLLFFSPIVNDINPLSGEIALLLSALLAAAALIAYQKLPPVQTLAALLVPMAFLYPIWFLSQNQIVFPGRDGAAGAGASNESQEFSPVFMIILDELSTEALVDKDLEIDAQNFPNFARLAVDGFWFRNGTSVAEQTQASITAIMTGKYQPYENFPRHATHPDTIFTLFAANGYDIYSFEFLSQICPDSINRYARQRVPFLIQMRYLATDCAVVAGHQFLNDDFTRALPSIEGRMAGFTKKEVVNPHWDTVVRFDDFMDSLSTQPNRLSVAHVELPHERYQYTPSGKRYSNTQDMPGIDRRGELKFWSEDGAYAARSQQRYLAQTRYVDTLLGEFIQRLEALGVYDDALIVVVADHGVNHRPGFPRRAAITAGHSALPTTDTDQDTGYNSAMDILKVPTFIKLPHQSSGKTLDQRFASVDILPTIAAALDLKSETNFEGIAALEKDALERTSYKFYSKYNQGFIEHDMNILSDTYDFRHKLRVLDETNNFAIRLPGYQRLNGIATANATLSTQKIGHTRLATPELYENVNPRDAFIPVLIEGEVDFLEPRAEAQYLAISINGIIKGVGKFYDGDHGSLRFSIFVQENDFSSGKNEIQVFLVERPESPDPVLTFLSTRTPK